MQSTHTFTSTITPDLIGWLDAHAKETKQTRRAVLEEAVRRYRKETKQEAMRAGFARASGDADTLEAVEWGMEDYAHITQQV